MKHFLNGVIALLLVLITSCCADLPDVVNPGGSPVTTHRSLSVKEVSNRLNGIWGTLPKSNPSTRNSDVLPADSIFALPGGEFDTFSDIIIDTRASVSDDTEEECDCDPLCGGTSSLTFYRKNHMIINIRP